MKNNYKLDKNFDLFSDNGINSIYLNKYTGDWFRIESNFQFLVDKFKEEFELSKLTNIERDIFDQLYESNVFSIKNVKNGYINTKVTLVIIEPLNYCNLACKYCFEDVQTSGSKMKIEIADSIIEKIEKMDLDENISIEFNGGESFLNLPTMEYIVQKCLSSSIISSKKIRFVVQSNATIFTRDVLNFIQKYKINLGISIDGIKEDNDRYRVFYNNTGTYETVIRNIGLLRQEKINFSVIATISEKDQVLQTYSLFKELEITSALFNVRRYSDRMGVQEIDYLSFAKEFLEVFKISLKDFKENCTGVILKDIAILIQNLVQPENPPYMCLRTPCGAGVNMMTFDVNGDLYACQDLIKEPIFKLCSNEDTNLDQKLKESYILNKLKERRPENIRGCSNCNWQRFCQGGCYSSSYFNTGKNFELSLETRSSACDFYYYLFSNLLILLNENPNDLMKYAFSTV